MEKWVKRERERGGQKDSRKTRVATLEPLVQGHSYCYFVLMELCYFSGIDWPLASSERATSQISPAMRKWIIREKTHSSKMREEPRVKVRTELRGGALLEGVSVHFLFWSLGGALLPLERDSRHQSHQSGFLSVFVNTGHIWGLVLKNFQILASEDVRSSLPLTLQ